MNLRLWAGSLHRNRARRMLRRTLVSPLLVLALALSLVVVAAPVRVEAATTFVTDLQAPARLQPGGRVLVTVVDGRDGGGVVTTNLVQVRPSPGLRVLPGTVKRGDNRSGSITTAIGTGGDLDITFPDAGVRTRPRDTVLTFELEAAAPLPPDGLPMRLVVGVSQDGGSTPTATDVVTFVGGVDLIDVTGPASGPADTVRTYTVRDAGGPGAGTGTTDRVEVTVPTGWRVGVLRVGATTVPPGTPTSDGTTDTVAFPLPSPVPTSPGDVIATVDVTVRSTADALEGTLAVRTSGGGTAATDGLAVTATPTLALDLAPAPVEGGSSTLTLRDTRTSGAALPVAGVEVVLPAGWVAGTAARGDGGAVASQPLGDGTNGVLLTTPGHEVSPGGTVVTLQVVPGADGTVVATTDPGTAAARRARLFSDVAGAYAIEVTAPAAVAPGRSFAVEVSDDRPAGEPAATVTHVDVTLPAGTAYVADSGRSGAVAVAPTAPTEGVLRFALGTTSAPGDEVLRLTAQVDADAAPGDVTTSVVAVPAVGPTASGSAETRIAAGAPEVTLFGAVRGPTWVWTVGLLQGTPNTGYALSLAGFADGCPVDGGTELGVLSVVTDADGVARFGAALDRPVEAVRVVDAGELVPLPLPDGTTGFVEGVTYLAADGFAGSACMLAGFGNDSWPTAHEVTAPGQVQDRITVGGSDRWYRVPVLPGARLTVTLSDLPADYDLAVFSDIAEAYASATLEDPVAQLDRAGAQHAPSAFSPSAFSPSAFSPSAFSPDAYSPSAFSPSAFSPSAFSPSAFSAGDYAPDSYSPSAFSPSAFSPSAFSPSAFSAAQVQSVIAFSATPGTAGEQLVVNTWDNDGHVYVRVSGAAGAFDPAASFSLDVQSEGVNCEPVQPLVAAPGVVPAGDLETIVLWDSTRTSGTEEELAALPAKLQALAADTRGVVVDVAAVPGIPALRAQAEEYADCVPATNLLADGIKQVVDAYRDANPLRYVVVVGGDDAIPFFRYPDQALLGPESDYEPPVAEGTISQSALRTNHVLGQDEYGATTVLTHGGGRQPIPDLAVGRLVETAGEIAGMIDVHLGLDGAVLEPDATLVTGYDFLQDAADAVDAELVAGTADGSAVNDRLVVDGDLAPSDPRSWTADQLRAAFLEPDQKHDLVYLAGHFSANSALAADYRTSMLTTELVASDVDLTGSIVFSGGCHSGYNIVDGHIVPGLTLDLDWAQAMARKGATLVAGTGYQYGDTDLVEYSERLYAQFARELRRGEGAQSVGEALVRAKLDYLEGTPDPRGLHHKSLVIAAVFGLPMTSVDMPGERLPADDGTGGVVPVPVADGTTAATAGETLGLASAPLRIEAPLTEQFVPLTVVQPDGTKAAGPIGRYLEGPDGTVAHPNEPILPLVTTDVTAAGTSLRGVAFRGGTYADESGVFPLSAAAATELRGVHVPLASEAFFPMRLATANYYGAIGDDGRTRLHVTPVQHRVDAVGDETATRRVFSSMDLELFYSDVVDVEVAGDGDDLSPGLSAPPRIVEVATTALPDPTDGVADVEFLVRVVGDPAAGIEQVWVTHTWAADGTTWTSLDLRPTDGDSGLWRGVLEDAAGPTAPALDFVAQAVSGVGLVALDDNLGAYHRTGGPVQVDDTPPAATALELTSFPTSIPFGSNAVVSARLTSQGGPVAGQRVLLAFGPTALRATTDANGVATATLPVTAQPGSVAVTAAFGGTAALARAGATSTASVTRVVSVLALQPDGTGGVDVSLTSAGGVPLGEQSVRLRGEDGQQLAVITAPDGTASVSASRFTALSGEVSGSYLGSTTYEPADATVVRDPAPTSLVLQAPSSVAYGTAATITATLTNGAGGVAAASVQFTVDGAVTSTSTDGTGVARLDVASVTAADGTVDVAVAYAGDVRNAAASDAATITVVAAPTTLQLADPGAVAVGDAVTLTATLRSGDAAVAGRTITFTAGGTALPSATTGTDGVATTTWSPTSDGEVTIAVAAAGGGGYQASSYSRVVQVDRRATVLQLTATPQTGAAVGVDSGVTALLTDSAGLPLAGRTVTFTVTRSGVALAPVVRTTGVDGRAALGVVDVPAGSYTVGASFDGDTTYSGSSDTIEVTVDARAALRAVRDRLAAAVGGLKHAQDRDKVNYAIAQLDTALDPTDWLGGRPIDDDVPTAIRKAVTSLEKVEKKPAQDLARDAIALLGPIARTMTVEAIAAATTAGAPGPVLQSARDELARGDQLLVEGRIGMAINRWEYAFAAVVPYAATTDR